MLSLSTLLIYIVYGQRRACVTCVTCAIGICYRPPDAQDTFIELLNESLTFVCNKFPGSPIIFAGGINYPGINSRTGTAEGGPMKVECKDFLDMISTYGLSQIVPLPTRGDAILDLVLTTEPVNGSVHVLDCISDHNVLHCDYELKRKKKYKKRKQFMIMRAPNVEIITSELSSFCGEFLSGMHDRDSNDNWPIVCSKLTEVKSIL